MRAEERAQMAGTEAGADAMGHGGVLDAAEPVVEGLEADTALGQLALGPFVSVGAAPQRIGGIGAHLDEGRSPLGVREVEVPVVGHRGLAAPGDVGMAGAMPGVGVVDVAPPHRGPLLGLAHEHETWPTGRCCRVLVRTDQVLFGLSRLESHDGNPGPRLQRLEFGHEPFVVAVEQGRRGNGATSVEEELDHPSLILQSRDVAPDADAIHRGAAEAHVLVQ